MMDYGFDALSVHVLVDLSDPESVVGIKAVAEWARDQDQAVQVWPFLREPINTAAEVPKGTPSFEAYKARRGLARRRYKDQERLRNLQRLSLNWPRARSSRIRLVIDRASFSAVSTGLNR